MMNWLKNWLIKFVLQTFPSCDCETFVKLRWDRLVGWIPFKDYLRTQVHRLECEDCNEYCCKVTTTEVTLKRDRDAPNLTRNYKMTEEAQQRLNQFAASLKG